MPSRAPNYIWSKSAQPKWLGQNEQRLGLITLGRHAVVERPGRARCSIECFCRHVAQARKLKAEFGGFITKLPSDWKPRLFAAHRTKPLRIGGRLTVTNETAMPRDRSQLIIPAGAAFGTGEHATTAMSLRLLERVSRWLPQGWRMLDAGTGSGILALAARQFGAGKIVAIDIDPMASATAEENARANGIRGVRFIVGDVRRHVSGEFDMIAANLYSELLAEMLPAFSSGLSPGGRMILSGVLRQQEQGLAQELRENRFVILETKRRGKWIALLAKSAGPKRRRRAAREEKRG